MTRGEPLLIWFHFEFVCFLKLLAVELISAELFYYQKDKKDIIMSDTTVVSKIVKNARVEDFQKFHFKKP